MDLRLDIERRKKHKERDLKRDKSRESVESRDSSHSRERSAEKTEKSHKGSKKKYVGNPTAISFCISCFCCKSWRQPPFVLVHLCHNCGAVSDFPACLLDAIVSIWNVK